MAEPPGPPPSALLMQTVYGPFVARCVWAVAELGIPDLLAERPRTPAEVATALDLHADPVGRLLGAMATTGVTAPAGEGAYANGPLGELLRSDVPGSLRDYVRYAWNLPLLRAWDRVLDVVRTGEPSFAAANGLPFFDYLAAEPELEDRFTAAMTALGAGGAEPLAAAIRPERFTSLVDVGGGAGLQLAALLRAAPDLRGVLLDLPSVVAQAPAVLGSRGVADRCEIVAGSFFDAIPSGADAYLLRTVLHDWSDEEASRILERVAQAAAPGTTLLVAEVVLPDGNAPHPGRFIDMHMMVVLGGRERSETAWRDLLAGAGFAMTAVGPAGGPISLIEATRSPGAR